MADLLMPQGKDEFISSYTAQRVSERSTAIMAATYLPHDSVEGLIADADNILLWLRQDSGSPVDPPSDAQNGAQEPSGGTDGQEEPPAL